MLHARVRNGGVAISYHTSQSQPNVMLVQNLYNHPNSEHYTEHQSELNDPLDSSDEDQIKDHPAVRSRIVTPPSLTNILQRVIRRNGQRSARLTPVSYPKLWVPSSTCAMEAAEVAGRR